MAEAVPVRDVFADPGTPRLEGVAYAGGPLRVDGWPSPVVFDLRAMPAEAIVPLCTDHEFRMPSTLGLARVANDGRELRYVGAVLRDTQLAADVVAWAAKAPLATSVGVVVEEEQPLRPGERANVNGREVVGPAVVIRGQLREVSIVPAGADPAAQARRAEARIYRGEPMDEQKREVVEAAAAGADGPAGAPEPLPELAAAVRERERVEAIAAVAREHIEAAPAATARVVKAKAEEAVAAGVSPEEFRAALRRHLAACVPATGRRATPSAEGVIAAACRLGGMRDLERRFAPEALEEADRLRLRSLADVIHCVASTNGYTGSRDPMEAVAYCARVAAANAPSTLSLDDVLAGTAERFLLDGYNTVDASWRSVAAIRAVRDFRTVTAVLATQQGGWQEIPVGGEIPHTAADDAGYPLTARAYALRIGIDRRILVNDDIGAVTSLAAQYGASAARTLAQQVWGAFIAAHLSSPASRALNIAGLAAAETVLLTRTIGGQIRPITPRVLVTSAALGARGRQLVGSQYVATSEALSSGGGQFGTTNPFAGMLGHVTSPYLSATHWCLCGEPLLAPAVLVGFVGGAQAPTIETVAMTPYYDGIAILGRFYFGVAGGPTMGVVANAEP